MTRRHWLLVGICIALGTLTVDAESDDEALVAAGLMRKAARRLAARVATSRHDHRSPFRTVVS